MAPRFRHQYQAPSGRSLSVLLLLDRTSMARTSVRSALDTCPNTAQRFATRPALCSAPRESFWLDSSYQFRNLPAILSSNSGLRGEKIDISNAFGARVTVFLRSEEHTSE